MANTEHVALLKQGVAKWNNWRLKNPDIRPDLYGAKLYGAHLREADLDRANLSGGPPRGEPRRGGPRPGGPQRGEPPRLNGANLTEANLGLTVFVGIDLTSVIGLETCDHSGPSIIDYQTLAQSGPLPLSFLRGVGLRITLLSTCLRC